MIIKSKKGIELAINTIVMIIIGLVIFGLGMGLFVKIANSGDDQIDNMRTSIVDSLGGLECDSQEWLCIPSISIDLGDSGIYYAYITNLDDKPGEFKLDFSTLGFTAPYSLDKSGCGTLILTPFPDSITINRGEIAKVPIAINTKDAIKACSFTTTVSIEHITNTGTPTPGNKEKEPMIIRVE